nr:FAD-binding protein [Actinomycetota bacterium]
PISGLYAAGNAAASPLGHAYPGAGGTIGPGLVFGMRAGEAAAAD